ncbi:MAG: TolC family protein [Sulfurovum sp.]|nr:TolC family protein [Sulfurovum sp.]
MKHLALSLSLLLISGCSLSQNPNIPTTVLPQNSGIGGSEKLLLNDRWWENFHDRELNLFVQEALDQNSDLKIATLQAMRFREFLNIKKSEQLPRIDALGSASKTKSYMASFDQSFTYDQFELGAMASYEIDLWGKLKHTKMAAFEDMMRESYLKESIKQRIIADSIIAYFGLKTNTKIYQITKEQYLNEKAFYTYMQNQYKAGLIRESDLLQEESLLQMFYDEMIKQQDALSAYKTAVAILLGKEPVQVFAGTQKVRSAVYSASSLPVPSNLPSDILQRRADIQASQAKVKSSAFLVSVAKSAFFPSISLSGTQGYVSGDLNRLISSNTSTYSAGGNLLSPILDFGKIQANIKAAKLDQQIALLEYQDTVRKAFGEVKDNLHAYASNKQRLSSQEKRYQAISHKKRIMEKQYKEGFATYLELLETRKEEFEVAISKEAIKFETLKSAVELYVSLGGGFMADTKNKNTAVSKM